MKPIFIALTIAFGLSAGLIHAETRSSTTAFEHESATQRDTRLKWFREARFGMFIHWGLYSEAAGYWNGKPTQGAGEWIMNDMQIPLSQYAKLVPEFNPVKFNADDWVKAAKNAGIKYLVVTTKHHDGFCMWPTKLTDWCIKSAPFKRDPLKELAAACKKEDIKLCFYYSIMDWHSPLYAPRKPWNDIATNPPDFDAYDRYMKSELKELLTDYGPIGTLWFDGCWESTWTRERGLALYNYLRKLQPSLIINNRIGSTSAWQDWFKNPEKVGGDFGTPEQSIPPTAFGTNLMWETCMTMNDTWGYKRQDHDWKSAKTLIRNLVDIASKGGNYLLNVGPTGEGLIPQASIERLKEIGDWMKVNGVAIYDTTTSPFPKQLPWGRCTQKSSGDTTTLYLHVFDWPADGKLLVPGLINQIQSASLLANGTKIEAGKQADGVVLSVPAAAPDKIASVIVLKLKGAPKIVEQLISQNPDGSILLPASEARLHGNTFKYESGGPLDDIGFWTNPGDWTDWKFKLKQPGTFKVLATIATPAASSFELSVADHSLRCATPATGNYVTFKPVELGRVSIGQTGTVTLAVHPAQHGWQPLNLKAIRLESTSPAE